MIEAVLFDAGYTLIFPDYDYLLNVLEEVGVKTSVEEIRYLEGKARPVFDELVLRGEKEKIWYSYYVRVFELLGLEKEEIMKVLLKIKDYNSRGLGYFVKLNEEAPPVLEELRERGLKLGVVSNSDGRIKAVLEHVGISHYFEVIVDSHDIGIEKPSSEIFEYASRTLSLETRNCVYVGDFFALDYMGAMKAGMIPVLYDPTDAYSDKKVRRIKNLKELIPFVESFLTL